MYLRHGVSTARTLCEHLRVDSDHIVSRHTGDARIRVVLCRERGRGDAVAVVVGLDLDQGIVDGADHGLHFRRCVGTACVLRKDFGVDRSEVVGIHTRDACVGIVLCGERGRRGAVAVVVGLDLGEGCIRSADERLHFRRGVGTAARLREHLGVDRSEVVGGHACDACVCIVLCGECGRGDAITVVVGLDLDQRVVHTGDEVLHLRGGVGVACASAQHFGVDSSEVACVHAGDACGLVVRHRQCGRCGAVAVVVGLNLGNGTAGGADQRLHFGDGVGTAARLREHLGVDRSEVVGGHACDACVCIVLCGECGRGDAITVVVGLDLDQRVVHTGDEVLHLRGGVGVACASAQHFGVDSSEVACVHAGDACGLVVRHRQCGRCGAVAVVVRINLGEGCIGSRDERVHFGQGVGTTAGLREHLSVDGRQVVSRHARDACVCIVLQGERGWCHAIAVVVGLDLHQRIVDAVDQGLHIRRGVGRPWVLRQDLGVDGRQVACVHTGNASGLVVSHRQRSRRGAIAVVVGLDLGQSVVGCGDQGLHFGRGVSTAGGSGQYGGVDSSQVVGGDAGHACGGIVLQRECGGRDAVAVVVSLDLGQSVVGGGDQGLYFADRVCATAGCGQHFGVDGGQVVGGDAGHACIQVVLQGGGSGCGAVAVVEGLNLGQAGGGFVVCCALLCAGSGSACQASGQAP